VVATSAAAACLLTAVTSYARLSAIPVVFYVSSVHLRSKRLAIVVAGSVKRQRFARVRFLMRTNVSADKVRVRPRPDHGALNFSSQLRNGRRGFIPLLPSRGTLVKKSKKIARREPDFTGFRASALVPETSRDGFAR